ncbi:hypothetical protein GCM10020001_101780 [Nonomuraea salmonea]
MAELPRGAGGGAGEGVDEAGVAGRGLEHQGRAAGAAGLPVEQDAARLAERVFADEGLGAEHAVLLAVGDEQDDVVAWPRAGAQRADGLQHGGHGGGVVGGARPHGGGVVVGGDEHGAGGAGAGQAGDDVVDLAERGQPRRGAGADGVLDLDVQPCGAQLGGEVGPGSGGGGAADGAGFGRELLEVGTGAFGAEPVGRRTGRHRLHGAVRHGRQRDHCGEDEEGGDPGHTWPWRVEQRSDHGEER